MKLYLVNINDLDTALWVRANYPDIGALCSFVNPKIVKQSLELGFDVLLDSGAYSVAKSGITIDIDKYIEYIKELKAQNSSVVPVSLDVIGNAEASIKNWNYMKEREVDVIPTYHIGEPIEVFDYYVRETDYIGLGGLVVDSLNWRERLKFLGKVWNRHPNKKYHVFGVNDLRSVRAYPFYSCDAKSWKGGSMFSQVITPHGSYFLSDRHSQAIGRIKAKTTQLETFLHKRGIPYPLPQDYDLRELNKLNIKTLYDEIVSFNEKRQWLATSDSLI